MSDYKLTYFRLRSFPILLKLCKNGRANPIESFILLLHVCDGASEAFPHFLLPVIPKNWDLILTNFYSSLHIKIIFKYIQYINFQMKYEFIFTITSAHIAFFMCAGKSSQCRQNPAILLIKPFLETSRMKSEGSISKPLY